MSDRLKLIPFVASSYKGDEAVTQELTSPLSKLSGEEASRFYEEVISGPCASGICKKKESPRKHKVIKHSSVDKNTRFTIFHYAQNGNIGGIEHCLLHNNHVDAQDMYGWTPLMCATFEGHYGVVEYLLNRGANLYLNNKQGLTAFDIAIQRNNKEIIELFKYGSSTHDTTADNNESQETKFCNLCNVSYKESSVTHARSIAHLLSSQDPSDNVSTFYQIPENNKGFQIMLKKGWDKNKGLGIDAKGRKFPVKTILKKDRACIGSKKEVAKVTHFGPNDYRSVTKNVQPIIKTRKEKKLTKSESRRLEKRNHQLEIEFRRQFHCD